MTTYICKCGRIERKSTNAATTGNRDTADCKGCPYLLPYGNQKYIQGEGYQLEVKGYECRMSQTLEYASRFVGSVSDKCVCAVVSLDFDFLWEISGWIQQNYPDGELSGSFSPNTIRAAEFSSSGRYRYSICCAQNKAGMAAKAALLERFFHPDGSRKDMSPEEEKKRVLTWIEESKRITQIAQSAQAIADSAAGHTQAAACLCTSCTCTGCHEECFGRCQGCGQPVDHCNSYQTEGEKRRTPQEEATAVESSPAPAAETMPAPAAKAMPAPAFDYGGLDAQTAARLQNLARRALESKRRYVLDMMEIVHEAHRELVQQLDKRSNQYSDATFVSWCASIGIGSSTAYNLLQVQTLMDNSSPEEQEVLEQAPANLLYAAARPSAPAELVAQVKAGDITTHKQYQELLAELKAREETIHDLTGQNEEFEGRLRAAEDRAKDASARADKAFEAAHQYHIKQQEANDQRNALLDQQAAYIARIAELEARPLGAAAPSEEQISRWRAEGAGQARTEVEAMAASLDAARDQLDRSEDKLRSAKNEANRLRETLSGRTDHLNAVEAELKALKAELRQARDAAKTAAAPSLPAAMPAEPKLVLCDDCIFSPICCGISLFAPDDLGEGTLAQFREEELDEDAFDKRLYGCTAGITKESR